MMWRTAPDGTAAPGHLLGTKITPVVQIADAAEAGDDWLLMDIARSVLARVGGAGWTLTLQEFWCQLAPPESRRPAQGWKLHVSATQLSAPVVLARTAEAL